MKEKLQQLMKSEGLTSSRLADILEIQPSGISHILSGRNKPGFDLLQKILRRFPRINPDWLLLDAPEMYRPDSENESASGSSTETVSKGELFGALPASATSTAADTNAPKKDASPQTDSRAAAPETNGRGSQRRISRIILVYDDRSFESLTPKDF